MSIIQSFTKQTGYLLITGYLRAHLCNNKRRAYLVVVQRAFTSQIKQSNTNRKYKDLGVLSETQLKEAIETHKSNIKLEKDPIALKSLQNKVHECEFYLSISKYKKLW